MNGTTAHGLWLHNGTDILYSAHSTTGPAYAQVSDPLSSNYTSWTHYAVTYNNNNTSMNLYRNAELISTNLNNASLNWPGGNGQLVIGSNFSPSSYGYLDNIRIFNTALTQKQITTIYNQEFSGSNWNYSFTSIGTVLNSVPSSNMMFELLFESLNSSPVIDTLGNTIISSSPAPTINTSVLGRGKYLELNANSYLYAPDFDISSSYTKMCWIYSKQENQGAGNLISSYQSGIGAHYFWFNNTTKLHAGHSGSGAVTPAVIDPSPPTLNTWIHYAITYDQASLTMYMYRNGQLVASSINNASLSWSGGRGKLGIGTFAGTFYFNGLLDNIRIFDVALTSVQVNNIYNQEISLGDGIMYRIYDGYFNDDLTFFSRSAETATGWTSIFLNLSSSTGGLRSSGTTYLNYSVQWVGYFYADVTGTWKFSTNSDDSSFVWIGNNALSGYTVANALINNSGEHGLVTVTSTISLTAGNFYPIRIMYGQGYGSSGFNLSFTPPNGSTSYDFSGRIFYSKGISAAFPAEDAKAIKALTSINTDGPFWLNVNGISTQTYCLMDSKWDGGGWMLMMKATRANTFTFSSPYWTNNTTTLNTTDLTRNDADAKYNAFNYMPVKDVMALWPDVEYKGGSVSQTDSWSWLVNGYNSGSKTTLINGLSTTSARYSPVSPDPTTFSGFSSSIWSTQTPSKAHVFGGGPMTANRRVRWGFVFNENVVNDFNTIDALGGIGLSDNYSGGDVYYCCGVVGMNRSMRYELYGR